jgi:hypothetical protein
MCNRQLVTEEDKEFLGSVAASHTNGEAPPCSHPEILGRLMIYLTSYIIHRHIS